MDEMCIRDRYMPVVKFTDDEAETLANIKNSILDQILQMSARWIAGESNIDEDWDCLLYTSHSCV